MLQLVRTLRDYRELIFTLVIFDIRARYKQSLLGVAWAAFQPLFTMVIFTIIFSEFAKVPTRGVPYPVFSYSALVFWSFFSTSLIKATGSLVSNAGLLRKIYFPREIFSLVAIFSGLFDLLVACVILFGLLFAYSLPPTWVSLWVLPVLLAQILFIFSIGLVTSVLHARFRDVGNAIGLIIQMWIFVSPVAYSVDLVPQRYLWAYRLNPMTGIIDSYRRALVYHRSPDPTLLGPALAIILVFAFLSYAFFKRQEINIVDVL